MRKLRLSDFDAGLLLAMIVTHACAAGFTTARYLVAGTFAFPPFPVSAAALLVGIGFATWVFWDARR